jgi:hypothetical protein
VSKRTIRFLFLLVFSCLSLGLPAWSATTDKDFTLDKSAGDSPSVIFTDQDDKTLSIKKLDAGPAEISNNEGALRFLSSNDIDDYLYLSTASDLPGLFWSGTLAYTNDPGIRIGPTGQIEYRDQDESAWSPLDSISAAGATQWTTSGSDIYYNTGNVGVGTTVPETKLYIAGSGDFAGFYVENAAIAGAKNNRRLGIGVGGPTAPVTNWVNSAYFESQATGGMYLGSFYDDFRFGAGNSRTTQMILKTTGNVGIGSTAPGSKLDVLGTLRLSGATSGYVGLAPAAAAGSTTYTLPSSDGSSGQVLSTDGAGTLSWASAGTGVSSISAGDSSMAVTDAGDGYLAFTEDGAEKMRITGGKLGLGATAPTGQLTVSRDNTNNPLVNADAHLVLENPNASGQTLFIFSIAGTPKGGVRGDFPGNFNWHATGGQGHQFYNSLDTSSPVLGMSSSGLEIGGAAGATARQKLDVIGNAIVSGNVGVGTTNPATKLHVVGAAATGQLDNLLKVSVSGANSYFSVYDNTSGASFSPAFLGYQGTDGSSSLEFIGGMDASKDAGTTPMIYFQARNGGESGGSVVANRDLFDFGNYSTSVMRIKANGNVGIGSSAPGSKLDVLGTLRLSGATSGYVGLAPAAAAGSTTYTLPSSDGSSGQVLSTDGSGTLSWAAAGGGSSISAGDSSMAVTDAGDGYLTFTEDGAEKMRITGGNVGIGTTTPAQKLTVAGTIRSEVSGTPLKYVEMYYDSVNDRGTLVSIYSTSAYKPLWVSASGFTVDDGTYRIFTAQKSTSNKVQWWSGTAAIPTADQSLIGMIQGTDGGSVPYGVALTEGGWNSTKLLKMYWSSDYDAGVIQSIHASVTANKYLLLNPSGGNVGIGSTAPGSKLDVLGTLRLSGATSGYVGLAPAAAAGSTTYTLPSSDGSSGQVLSTNGSGTLSWASAAGSSISAGDSSMAVTDAGDGYLAFTEDGAEKMRITGGNVGIGTTSPMAMLHVLKADTTRASGIRLQYSAAADPFEIWSDSAKGFFDASGYRFLVGGGNAFFIEGGVTYSGYNLSVGSGFHSPSALIHGIATTEQLRLGYNASNYSSFTTSSVGNLTVAPSGGVTSITGNVGIGSTDPGSKLDVLGTLRLSGATSGYVGLAPAAAAGSTTYTLPSADGSSGQFLSTDGSGTLSWATASGSGSSISAGDSSMAVTDAGDGYLAFTEDGSEIMRVTGGNVGIGTTIPTSKLFISGTYDATNPILKIDASADGGSSNLFEIDYNIGSTPILFGVKPYSAGGGAYKGEITGVGRITGLGNIDLSSAGTGSSSAINIASQNLTIGYDGSLTFIKSYDKSLVFQSNAGGELVRILTDGNVGIGSTVPGSKLDVLGTLRLSGSTSGYVGLAPAATAGSTTYTLPSSDGSSGQVLSTDGSGTLSWASAGGSSISAGDSSMAVTDAGDGYLAFTEDGAEKMRITGGSVGIGTTSPVLQFQVNSNNASGNLGSFNLTGSKGITFNPNVTAGIVDIYGDYLTGGSEPKLHLSTYSQKATANGITIDTNGNVGIGTIAPGYLLSLGAVSKGFSEYNSGGAVDAIKVVGNNLGANFGTQNLNAAGYSGVEYIDNAGSVAVFTGYKNGGTGEFRFNNIATNGFITFKIATNDKLTIANTGNIGIGITSPATPLHVEAAAYTGITNNPILNNINTTNGFAANMGGGMSMGGKYNSGGDVTTFGYIGAVKENSTSGDYSGKLILGTRVNGGGASDMTRMTILSSGNVGIGSTAPGSKLDVLGTLRLSGATSGYVGLAPAAAAGTTTYTLPSSDGSSGQVLSTDGSGTLSWASAGGSSISAGDSSMAVTDSGDGYLAFTEDGSEKMRIFGGNVGVGTTTPGSMLHVAAGSTTSPVVFFHKTGTTGPTVRFQDDSGDAWIAFRTGDASGGTAQFLAEDSSGNIKASVDMNTANGTIALSANGSANNHLFIDSTGNVGIGTTSSAYKLKVWGNIYTTGSVYLGAENDYIQQNGGIRIVENNEYVAIFTAAGTSFYTAGLASKLSLGTSSVVVNDSGNDVDFRVESSGITDAFFIEGSSGNVGIGSTAPGSKLDVLGTLRLSGATSGYVGLAPAAAAGSTTYTLPSSDGSSGQVLSTDGAGVLSWATAGGGSSISAGDSSMAVTDAGDGYLAFTEDGAEKMRITGGNVGIGTTSPGNKLTVTGPTTADALADVMIGASATTQKGLVVQGKASQTANLQEWQNSAGTRLTHITSAGRLGLVDAAWGSPNVYSVADANGVGLRVGSGSVGFTYGAGEMFTWTGGNPGLISMNGYNTPLQMGTGPVRGVNASGTNANGGSLYLAGGAATGNAVGGSIFFQTSDVGASGASGQSLSTKITLLAAGNVGIGSTAPGSKLDVLGTLRLSGATSGYVGLAPAAAAGSTTYTLPSSDGSSGQVLSTNGSGTLSWATAGGGSSISAGDSSMAVTDAGDGYLAFTEDGSEKMRITGGNVGIGTTAPNKRLHVVEDTTGVAGFRVQNPNAGNGAQIQNVLENNASYLAYYGISSSNYTGFTPINGGKAFFGSYLTDTSIFTQSAKDVIFYTNAAEVARITSAGNVGIGSAAPGSKLDVLGTLRLSGATSGYVGLAPAAAAGSTTYTLPSSDGSSGQVLSTNGSGTLSWASAAGSSISAGDSSMAVTDAGDGYLAFTEDGSEKVRITGGKVGIGTTVPTAGWKVSVKADQALRLIDANTDDAFEFGVWNGSGDNWALFQAYNRALSQTVPIWFEGEKFTFQSGSVGIGSTSPGSALDVKGTLRLSGSTSGYVGLAPAAAAGSTTYTLPSSDGSSGQALVTNGSGTLSWGSASAGGSITAGDSSMAVTDAGDGYLAFTEDGSETMRITGGNVGIGTTVPGGALDVRGAFRLNSPGGGYIAQSSNGPNGGYLKVEASNNWTQVGWGFRSVQSTSGQGAHMWTGTGNSATAPNIYFGPQSANYSATGVGAVAVINTTSGAIGIGSTNPGSSLDVKGTLRLSGATSGYVGLAPAAVAGSTTYTLPSSDGSSGQVLSTDGSGTLSWASAGGSSISAGDSSMAVTDAGDGYLAFTEDGAEKMRVTGGNVGIGTTTPAGNLQIGSTTSTSTATPSMLDMGGSFADSVTSSKAKWKLYSDGTAINTYGIGISLGQFNFFKFTGGSYNWYFSDVEKMRLTSDGYLGLGATTPEVLNSVSFSTIKMQASNASTSSYLAVNTDLAGGYAGIIFNRSGANANNRMFVIDSQPADSNTSSTLSFSSYTDAGSPTSLLTMLRSGNVGIGSTAPGSKLDVLGTLRLSGSTSGYVGLAPAAAAGSTTYTLPSSDGSSGQVLSTNGSGTLSWASAAGSSISAGDSSMAVTDAGDGYLTFTEDGSEKMRITDGNVGIGTAAPSQKLSVSGNVNLTTGGYVYGDTTSQSLQLSSGAGSILSYGSNQVNIGPSNIRVNTSITGTTGLNFYGDLGGGVAGRPVTINAYNGSAFRVGLTYDNVSSGEPPLVLVPVAGNVGVGLNLPTAALHLKAGTATAGTAPLKLTAGTNLGTTEAGAIEFDGTHLYFTATDAGTRYQLDQQSSSGANTALSNLASVAINTSLISDTDSTDDLGSTSKYWANTYSDKIFTDVVSPHADGTSAVQINKADGTTNVVSVDTTNSRLGVGAAVPGYTLDVVTSEGNTVHIQTTGTGTQQASFFLENSRGSLASFGGNFYGGTGYTSDDLFGLDRADKYFVAAGGASNLGMAVGTISAQPLVLGTNNTEQARIDSAGKVGIGVTVPTAALHLKAGTATASTAPLKLTAGTNLGTTEAGAIEFDGTHLYFTAANAGTRYQLDQQSAASQTPWTSNINAAGYSLYGLPKIYPSADSTTAFQINKADGTTNVLNVDTTNARVGIGASTPDNLLHIEKSQNAATMMHVKNTNAGASAQATGDFESDAGHLYVGMGSTASAFGGGSFLYTGGAYPIEFWVNGTEYMRLTSVGLLGIGSSNPAEDVQIYKTANAITGLILDTPGTGDAQQSALYLQSKGDGTKALGTVGTKGWGFFARGDAFATAALRNDLELYYANGASWTHVMEFQNDGAVGVGVTAPTAALHLKAGTATANTAPLKLTAGTNLGTTEAGAIEFDGTHLYFTAADAGTRYQLDQQSSAGANTALSNLASVAVNTSLISDTDSTDDLGSTTKNWANVYADNLKSASADTGLTIEHDGQDQDISFKVNDGGVDTTVMTLDGATSRFGIGISSPAVAVHIADNVGGGVQGVAIDEYRNANVGGTLRLRGSRNATVGSHTVLQNADAMGGLSFAGSDGAAFVTGASITAEVDGTPGGTDMPGRLLFYTTPDGSGSLAERMRITNAGYFGMGMSSPAFFFHIADNLGSGVQGVAVDEYRAADVGATLRLRKSRHATTGSHTIVTSGDTTGVVQFFGSDGSAFLDTSYIASQVDGTPGSNDMPGRLVFYTTPDGATTGTEKMRITNTGAVGIKTSGPGRALEVNDSSGSCLRLTYNDADGSAANYSDLTVSSAGALTLQTAGTNAGIDLKTVGTGGVAINSGSPVKKLLTATASLNFGNMSGGASDELTITVTGAALGDTVIVNPNGAPESGLTWQGYVSSADTVTVRASNPTTGNINPAARTWRATVISF